MGKLNDLTGNRYGSLFVFERRGINSDNRPLWLCRCDCGREVLKSSKRLKSGREFNCGEDHPTKICSVCKQDKDKATDYHKANAKKISPLCKECRAMWYKENGDLLKGKYKERMLDPLLKARKKEIVKKSRSKPENKEREKRQKKEYLKREDVILRRRGVHHKRKATDLNYNIKRRLRWRIRDVFKDLGLDKKYRYKSSIVLLGCDMEFFKSYIESKFTDGMCWERISEIHIDHKIPCSHFDLTKIEEQKKCFHYSNLQPLWWEDNLKKGSKYDPMLTDNSM